MRTNTLILGLVSAIACLPMLAGCGDAPEAGASTGSTDTTATPPVSAEKWVDQVLTALDCPTRRPWGSSDPTVAVNYNCGSGGQEFVYFFATEGDQSVWLNRVLSGTNPASLVAGPGWAVSTATSARAVAAVNYGGTLLR